MKKTIKTFEAFVVDNGKFIKGKLLLSDNEIAFYSNNQRIYTQEIIIEKCLLHKGIEKITKMLLFSTTYGFVQFEFDNSLSRKFYFEANTFRESYETIYKFISIARKIAAERKREEVERKHQEELARREVERKRQEDIARREAERKRQEEFARQETERKKQEELVRQEEERKRREEFERQEAERKQREELEQQEAERKRMEELEIQKHNNLPFAELESIGNNNLYIQKISSLLIEYFRALIQAEDPYQFIEDNMDMYEKILCYMEDNNLPKRYSATLENLLMDASEMELAYDAVAQFIYSICEEIDAGMSECSYDSIKRNRGRAQFESQYNIDEDLLRAKKEERERRLALYQKQYKEILAFIQRQRLPFNADYVLKNVPGANRNVFRDVVGNESKILNFYKEYIWYDRLHINEYNCSYIRDLARKITSDRETHHISEMYDQLLISDRDFLRENMITSAHRLFSIVQYICDDILVFERPYFSRKGVRILNAQERIEKYIRGKNQIKVKQILEYAQNNYMQIPNIIDLINSLNATHLFEDKYTLVQYSHSEFNSKLAAQLELAIKEELEEKGCIGICELSSYNKFPTISVPWTEWLVYSVLLKWGRKYTITTAGNTYKVAIPVVALKNSITVDKLDDILNRCKDKSLGSVVDVTNVDDVFNDVLDDILDDLEF